MKNENYNLARKRKANRSKKQLKNWTRFDDDALDFCGRFGVGSIDQIRVFCEYKNRSISEKRIKLLAKAGFLKTEEITIDNKTLKIYMLDKDGKKYCEDIGTKPRSNIYIPNKLKHDYKHSSCISHLLQINGHRKISAFNIIPSIFTPDIFQILFSFFPQCFRWS